MRKFLALLCVVALSVVVAAEDEKEEKPDYGTVIGIDLGTTYSCVGVYRDGKVEIIPNEQGNRITPSYVAFTEDGQRLVGDAAKNQASLNPRNTVFDVKRFIGRKFGDRSVQHDKSLLPFELVNSGGRPGVEVDIGGGKKKVFRPEEISSMVLGKMKVIAEKYLNDKVKSAVVTVPAYFTNDQRQATKDAGTIAGLNVLRIINEPTAAALAYGLEKKSKDRNILVYDLGGGTFDVSILTLDGGVFEVLATNGDTHLGGEDFDQRIMAHFIDVLKKRFKKDISDDRRAKSRLRREAEKAKRALSTVHQTKVEIESFVDGADFSQVLTRAKFEELNNDLFEKTLKPVARVLKDAGLKKRDIHEIVLVGGSTRIPKVRELITKFFRGKKLHTDVNPDEAVAYGAAVQGGILSGKTQKHSGNVLLLDVTPLSLGIELTGGVFAKLIERNTVIPTKKSEIFTTDDDDQTELLTSVYQGERPRASDNVLLGEFTLTGIPPAPRGEPEIEVTFELDSNGILNVKAQDKKTGNAESLTIKSNDKGLDEAQIEKMVQDAAKYEEEDRKFREQAAAREDFEGYVYQIRHRLRDEKGLGGRLSEDDRNTLTQAVAQAMSWVDNNEDLPKVAYEKRKKRLKALVDPIVARSYENDDVAPGAGAGYDEESSSNAQSEPDEFQAGHDEL